MSDYWRDKREHDRKQRRQMVYCAGCNCRKVFPGEPCIQCLQVTDKNGHIIEPQDEETPK